MGVVSAFSSAMTSAWEESPADKLKEAIRQSGDDPSNSGTITLEAMLRTLHLPDAKALAILRSSRACIVKYSSLIDYVYGSESGAVIEYMYGKLGSDEISTERNVVIKDQDEMDGGLLLVQAQELLCELEAINKSEASADPRVGSGLNAVRGCTGNLVEQKDLLGGRARVRSTFDKPAKQRETKSGERSNKFSKSSNADCQTQKFSEEFQNKVTKLKDLLLKHKYLEVDELKAQLAKKKKLFEEFQKKVARDNEIVKAKEDKQKMLRDMQRDRELRQQASMNKMQKSFIENQKKHAEEVAALQSQMQRRGQEADDVKMDLTNRIECLEAALMRLTELQQKQVADLTSQLIATTQSLKQTEDVIVDCNKCTKRLAKARQGTAEEEEY